MAAEFRPATLSDVEAILALQHAYYDEEGYPFVETEARVALTRLVADSSLGRAWVAEQDQRAIAYAVLTLGYSLEYRGRDAFVDEIYVAPVHRGRGLGRQALQVMESACRSEGVRALHLEVELENQSAGELYRSVGFRDHARRLMTKLLS